MQVLSRKAATKKGEKAKKDPCETDGRVMERITEEQYNKAVTNKDEAHKVINEYFRQRQLDFEERMKTNPIFTDEELFYSREARCPCGAGLAYPKACGTFHYWDCSAILKGVQDLAITHCAQYPFTFYRIKGELNGESTRP